MNILSKYVLFVFLLPIFFVLHSYSEYYDLVPLEPALRLTFWYLIASAAFMLIYYIFLKNIRKAGLMTFLTMSYHFFFGSVQDLMNKYFPNSFATKYSFILLMSLVLFIAAILLLKRGKQHFTRVTLYLNLVMLVIILVDTSLLWIKMARKQSAEIIPEETILHCDTCPTPDIYLLIADAYPGKLQFKNILNYDNSRFEDALKQRGFYITDSSFSNYNFTFFSMSSLLNFNYLRTVSGSIRDIQNIPAGSKVLKNSLVLRFFKNEGYSFYNFSPFDFVDNRTKTKPTFWINDTRPVTSQTFLSRLNRDLGYHLVTTFKVRPINPYPIDQDLKNNEILYAETIKAAKTTSKTPKFIYTHLTMPHNPYYYDSTGTAIPLDKLTKEYAFDRKAAVQYIVYTNRKFLSLIDTILASSPKPPIILLLSDHGFREIKEEEYRNTMFLNLNTVYFPDKDYTGFYRGMSNVNLFRLLLNKYFGQKLPFLKDSAIFLSD